MLKAYATKMLSRNSQRPAAEVADDLETRIQELTAEAREAEARFASVKGRASALASAIEETEAQLLLGNATGADLTRLRKEHAEVLSESQNLAETVAEKNRLLSRARQLLEAEKARERMELRSSLEAEHREVTLALVEALAVAAAANEEAFKLHKRAFDLFPHGPQPTAPPLCFYGKINPWNQLRQTQGTLVTFYVETARDLYGVAALGEASKRHLEVVERVTREQAAEEERRNARQRRISEESRRRWKWESENRHPALVKVVDGRRWPTESIEFRKIVTTTNVPPAA